MYVDTSVIVSLLTDEPKTQACKDWFRALTQAPISGDWLVTEFYSAIALKQELYSDHDLQPWNQVVPQRFHAWIPERRGRRETRSYEGRRPGRVEKGVQPGVSQSDR